MTPTEPVDVAQMAMIECLRQIADGNKKLGTVLEGMQSEIRDVRERLIRIEASEFKAELTSAKNEIERLRKEDLKAMDARVDALELDKGRRDGVISAWDWLLKSWPALVGFIGLVVAVLLANGRIKF
jgi:hypothetical protein